MWDISRLRLYMEPDLFSSFIRAVVLAAHCYLSLISSLLREVRGVCILSSYEGKTDMMYEYME